MSRKEMLESRGFTDEKHLKSWLKECQDESWKKEVIAYFGIKETKVEEPEVKEPEIKEPEVKEPEVKEPETKEPETKEPEIKADEEVK